MKKIITIMIAMMIISLKCLAGDYSVGDYPVGDYPVGDYYDPDTARRRLATQQAEYVQYVQEKLRQHRLEQEAKNEHSGPSPSYRDYLYGSEESKADKKKKKRWYKRW